MNRSNGLCNICNNEMETLDHLFYYCNYATQVRQLVRTNICNKVIHFDTTLNEECVFLGDTTNNNAALNSVIFTMKWAIWKIRNIKKYQNKITSPNSAFIMIRHMLLENIKLYTKCTPQKNRIEHYNSLQQILM